jgi:hypothetical protein
VEYWPTLHRCGERGSDASMPPRGEGRMAMRFDRPEMSAIF